MFHLLQLFELGFKSKVCFQLWIKMFYLKVIMLCCVYWTDCLIVNFFHSLWTEWKHMVLTFLGDASLYIHYTCRQALVLVLVIRIHTQRTRGSGEEKILSTKVTLYCITLWVWKTIDILWVGDCLEPQIFVCKQMLPHTHNCRTKKYRENRNSIVWIMVHLWQWKE